MDKQILNEYESEKLKLQKMTNYQKDINDKYTRGEITVKDVIFLLSREQLDKKEYLKGD